MGLQRHGCKGRVTVGDRVKYRVSCKRETAIQRYSRDFLGDRKRSRQKAEECRRLINMKMEVNQSMDEYIGEFKTTVSKLQEMDSTLDKDLLVVVLLGGLSGDYRDFQLSTRRSISCAQDF